MLEYLNEVGLKNVVKEIPEEYPNVFINNGRSMKYLQSGEYNVCSKISDWKTFFFKNKRIGML